MNDMVPALQRKRGRDAAVHTLCQVDILVVFVLTPSRATAHGKTLQVCCGSHVYPLLYETGSCRRGGRSSLL